MYDGIAPSSAFLRDGLITRNFMCLHCASMVTGQCLRCKRNALLCRCDAIAARGTLGMSLTTGLRRRTSASGARYDAFATSHLKFPPGSACLLLRCIALQSPSLLSTCVVSAPTNNTWLSAALGGGNTRNVRARYDHANFSKKVPRPKMYGGSYWYSFACVLCMCSHAVFLTPCRMTYAPTDLALCVGWHSMNGNAMAFKPAEA